MKKIISGKVREVYDLEDGRMVIVTTDRLSAFDVILPTLITDKGKVLNALSNFWFDYTKDIVKNHMISSDLKDMPAEFQKPEYEGRTIDGNVFDATSKHHGAKTDKFNAGRLIKGWTEALTMMPVGSKWEIYIPQELAYGERGAGQIPPYSTLVFDLELVSIVKPEVKEAQPATEVSDKTTAAKKVVSAKKLTPAKKAVAKRRK